VQPSSLLQPESATKRATNRKGISLFIRQKYVLQWLAQLTLNEASPGILNLIIAALHRRINQKTFTESKMMNAAALFM